ncbi:FAD-binding protein [Herbidospora sp. NEAU-GS84]|uniref:FAD-binding protein n=1 Tax=Herbidospora solisilvae TaxID=2696284 RepID=A0A7C9P311_9ACTN|nr:FAD-binding oxidoreductase [Herbidospora solisilvae]NAS27077.1 FAD-binding protein [Herbidospora solisilvae]
MTLLTGWGRMEPTRSTVLSGDDERLADAVRGAGPRGVLARGSGRSYGDAAGNSGGVVLDMTARHRILSFDRAAGLIRVEAGLTLDALLRAVVPAGWCPPVLPGTAHVTVGGAIAADVHGKNHADAGSFGDHVTSVDLLTADGTAHTLTHRDALLRATMGGMGLTGVVLRADLRLRPLDTAWVTLVHRRVDGLRGLLDGLSAVAPGWHAVARLDPSAGRGVLSLSAPARLREVPTVHRAEPLRYLAPRPLPCPPLPLAGLARPRLVGAANRLLGLGRRTVREVRPLPVAMFPLDRITGWNRVYGRSGLLQYQFVVPASAEAELAEALRMVAGAPVGVPLLVLKRLGRAGPGLLSFPMDGWTLAADFPAHPALAPLLARLDALVAAAGGRVYLAKDAGTDPRHLPAMYPGLTEFRRLRGHWDPAGVFRSDLARRLSL